MDVICDRAREQRSQIVFTHVRRRDMVFWQSPRTRKQSRPEVALPQARAQPIADLEIVVEAHERYPFTFCVSEGAGGTQSGVPPLHRTAERLRDERSCWS